MSVTVRFACGHQAVIGNPGDVVPVCPTCGESRVQHVKAKPPRFVGCCSGPYAETKALDAVPMNLAPKGPLVLKEDV